MTRCNKNSCPREATWACTYFSINLPEASDLLFCDYHAKHHAHYHAAYMKRLNGRKKPVEPARPTQGATGTLNAVFKTDRWARFLS